jgi:hypothetical protein
VALPKGAKRENNQLEPAFGEGKTSSPSPEGPEASVAECSVPSADICCASLLLQSCFHDTRQTSHSKFDRLLRATAGFTYTRLDGYGLCCSLPTRPRVQASYQVLVRRHTSLLHASFRPHLAMTPLRFANPSPPSGWMRDLHLQTVEHARHTKAAIEPPWKTLRVSHFPSVPLRLGFL